MFSIDSAPCSTGGCGIFHVPDEVHTFVPDGYAVYCSVYLKGFIHLVPESGKMSPVPEELGPLFLVAL